MTTTTALRLIPLSLIFESPFNPRKLFDPVALANLQASIEKHGQLTPALVRPVGSRFELAAGHRRYRSSKGAHLETLECKVREMTDAELIEILTIENEERADVHPLEQAEGYKLLMERAGYDVAKIAERIQRSHDFVYDRLAMLELIPELKEHFLAGRFQMAHASLLAKLSADQQRRANDRGRGGLWRYSEPTLGKEFPVVANTAAELEYWIATELRFVPDAVQLEEVFPETAALLESAVETGTRVVAISHDDYLRPDAKAKDGERTFTAKFWKRADGLEGSKECEYAVVGTFAAGEGWGGAIGVCLRRDKCVVHWKAEVAALKAREKAKKPGGSAKSKAKTAVNAQRAAARQRLADKKRNEKKSRSVAAAELIDAQLDALVGAPTKAAIARARAIFHGKPGQSIERVLVAAAVERSRPHNLVYALENEYQRRETLKNLKGWGIDAAKIEAAVKVAMCIHCGCSEENACRLGQWGGGPSCKWVSKDPLVCSKPECVALWKGTPAPAKKDAHVETLDAAYDEGDDDE